MSVAWSDGICCVDVSIQSYICPLYPVVISAVDYSRCGKKFLLFVLVIDTTASCC